MNKKLICAAVGGTLGLGLSATVQADGFWHMLIPYVVKDSTRTTVVTLIGHGEPVSVGASIHLQYWTKSTTAANTAACEPNSVTLPFTDNDIVTFDTAGLLGYPLFGDTTNPAPLGTAISYAAPRHGYLSAYTIDEGIVPPLTNFLLAGYWLELDIANGGAHGGIAFNGLDGDQYGSLATNFHNLGEPLSGDPVQWFQNARAVNFWPSSVASTVFTVTPLGTAMDTKENNQVVLQVFNSGLDGLGDGAVQGAYDRNENGVDGTVPVTVRCVGRVTPAQLMPGVSANAAWAAQGGWGFLANLGDGDTNYSEGTTGGDLPVVVWQVDTSTAAGQGKFISNATEIVGLDF